MSALKSHGQYDVDEVLEKKKASKPACLLAFLAERVGFEPTEPRGSTDFESKSKLVFSCPARMKPTFS